MLPQNTPLEQLALFIQDLKISNKERKKLLRLLNNLFKEITHNKKYVLRGRK